MSQKGKDLLHIRHIMKATLTFNLPDDQHEFDLAVHGSDFYSILFDLNNEMRSICKYEEHSDEVYDIVERLRNMLLQGTNRTGIEI